ncbi:MAG: apolipoprotein N-acyltransferase [Bacteriovoracaceae bacterium]|nr:apolipoprotein N-acyltransferase [Bacteriovoracaceae bacterium]
MKLFKEISLTLFGGILYSFGFPNFFNESFLITPILGTGILLYFLDRYEGSIKKQIYFLLAFFVGHTYSGYFWIPKTLEVFGELPLFIALLLGGLFAFICMPYYWVYLVMQRPFEKFMRQIQFMLKQEEFVPLFKALWLTLIQEFTPQLFPGHLGHPWIAIGKYLGLAPIFGSLIYSFLSFWLVLLVIEYFKAKKKFIYSYAWIGVLIILNFVITLPNLPKTESLPIRISQANIGNYLKIESEKGVERSVTEVLDSFLELSSRPYQVEKYTKPAIVIWSETSYPYSISSEALKEKNYPMPEIFRQVIANNESEFVTGGYDQKTSQFDWFEREYNTAFHFSDQGKLLNVYHKMKLIPFGETLPFGPLNIYIQKYIPNMAFFKTGENYTLFETRQKYRFITPICYELLESKFIREYLMNNPLTTDFILNLTNDSWYEAPEPRQHLFLAKWRSVEFNIPIIRSTNTGITSIIYPDSTESERLNTGEFKNLDLVFKFAKRHRTFYEILGVSSLLMLFCMIVIFYFIFYWKRNPFSISRVIE